MIITFSGVDGAGKTTILKEFRKVLESRYNLRVIEKRHRPSIFPILSAFVHGKKEAERLAAHNRPHRGQNNSKLSSYLRFFYYLLDYLIGQVLFSLKYSRNDTVILYDRYYFDFIADVRRFNMNLSSRFMLKFYHFITKPELNIFLYANADTILERKQEMKREDIVLITDKYLELFERFSFERSETYLSIENVDKVSTLNLIESELKKCL